MNQQVGEKGSYIVHQYGCCGTFFFFVAEAKTKAIKKRTLPNLEAAFEWIDLQTTVSDKQIESPSVENVILSVHEVSNESHA